MVGGAGGAQSRAVVPLTGGQAIATVAICKIWLVRRIVGLLTGCKNTRFFTVTPPIGVVPQRFTGHSVLRSMCPKQIDETTLRAAVVPTEVGWGAFIVHAAKSETSSNSWKLRVISDASFSAWVVEPCSARIDAQSTMYSFSVLLPHQSLQPGLALQFLPGLFAASLFMPEFLARRISS